jgi:hypothetical protein
MSYVCRKIRLIEGNAQRPHLKKFTSKGTLRKVFEFIDWRLTIPCIHQVMLVFSTQLWDLLPLFPSLWFNSPGGGVRVYRTDR